MLPNSNQKSSFQRFLFLGAIGIFALALGLFFLKSFGSFFPSSKSIPAKKVLFLFLVQNEKEEPIVAFLTEFFPKEKKAALFFINPLIAFENESETLLEKKGNSQKEIEKQIKESLGVYPQYSFVFTRDNIVKVINLLGGLEIFIDPKSPKETESYLRNAKLYTMDGEDVMDYISFLNDTKMLSYVQRLDRQESVILTLFETLHEKNAGIPKSWIQYIHSLMDSNISLKDWESLVENFRKERIHFGISELPGEPVLRNKTKDEYLRARNETVKVAFQKFSSDLRSVYFSDGDRARIEVLNGTSKNGLAKYGKSLLNEKRLKVLSVGNAWDSEFAKTMILDRSGNTQYADKISETFQGRKVYHVLRKDLGLDASVILGSDFQGNP